MKIFARVVIVVCGLCVALNARSQNTTNSGTEFWTAYMDHNSGAGTNGVNGSIMSLYITSAVNTSGKVEITDGSFTALPFNVLANQVTIITIPEAAYLPNVGVANKGIHITSLKPVAIYAHIYASNVSGATLLLPVSTLGKDYLSINYTQRSNAPINNPAYSSFAVVATEDNTTVQITPAALLVDGHPAGTLFPIALKKGQVYQGLSTIDLTGTKITAINTVTGGCTKVAFFSGSSKIEIGCNPAFTTSDNLFQQVYPTAAWGKNYITVPLESRNYDIFRIVLSNPSPTTDPNVKLNGTPILLSSFTNGYFEFPSQTPNVITSDLPIQVAQYAVSQDNTIDCGTVIEFDGDPEMIYLNPLEQTLDHVTLYSTGNYRIDNSFINVVIKSNAASTFVLDGNPYTNFKPVPGNPLYSFAQIYVASGPQNVQVSSGSQGTHTLSAGDGFNAIAYGFGKAESYGYAAGTNLQNLNENIAFVSPITDTLTQVNGCTGTSYKLELTLPYQTTNILWDFKNGTTFTDSSPKVVSTTVKSGQTLYHYEYYKPVTYTVPGDTSITATVFNPVAGECGNNETVEFDFNISSPPVANFSIANACFGDSTLFTDKTNTNGSFIKTWLWDFGDQTTSALQNPKHVYTKAGNYLVKLTVANVNGCGTDTTQLLSVNPKPVAAFTVSSPDCAGQLVTLTDQSTSAAGNIVKWVWDYGDGKKDTLTNNKPFSHLYAKVGADTVKLTVILNSGCLSEQVAQIINVNPIPVADFSLPDVCLSDTYAQFTDKSSITDLTEGEFTYLWDFGDPNASVANPNTSTLQNPQHKYSQANNYNVTLTVTSKYGCIASKTQVFTVNGDIPRANFAIENAIDLCSMDAVIFDDMSTVNFGSITKMVWYFDYNNNPADSVVFDKGNIPSDHKFNHNYGLFNSPVTKNYTVRLDVYSGISCVSSTQQNITVKANPLVTLSAIGPLCEGDQPVQIIENKNGFAGIGVFTGKGVSAKGLFDPGSAGAGIQTVNYTFTAQNGCAYSTGIQIKVYANPTISAEQDITMLEGAQLTLPVKATGDSLTYKWTPSVGLNHDDILNPVASPSENITYKLVVTNPQGCTAATEININVLKYPVVPNAFTPNGDGINDTWDIKYLTSYPDNTVEIYNRYGEKIYSSIGYASPWDGKFRGNDLPAGTYYYVINPKNGRKAIAGSVTIIR